MKPKRIKSGAPQPLANYTEASRIGDFVFAAGQLASDFETGIAPGAKVDPAFPYYGSDIKRQTDFILKNLAKTFKAAGTSLDNVVKAQVFMMDLDDFDAFDEVWKQHFKTPPPRTTVGTTGLLVKDTLVEIDLIAYVPKRGLKAEAIQSAAPRPLAHYTEAVRVGDLVFAAGQLASDFKNGIAPEAKVDPAFPYYGSDIKRQTDYILKNLAKTFKAAGTSLDNVVKAQVFMMDLKDFNAFDEVWKQHFKTPPPRTTVGTTGLLVKDTLVEIDLIAHVPKKGVKAKAVQSSAPRPLAHYTEAVRVGDLVFAAGQLASDFKTGIAPEAKVDPAFPYYGSDIKRQAEFILKNLKKTFEAAGGSLDNVVKAQVFMMDLKDFNAFDEVWKQHFKTPPPRTTVGTTGLLVKDTLVEIDLIGAVK
jgi:reactive intermediate/imine deaminase